MWLLLVLTAGGAAFLSHARNSRWQTALQAPAVFGPIEVRLPRGWQVAPEDRGNGIQIIARDPGTRKVLAIAATSAEEAFDAMEYFMRTQALALSTNGQELIQYDEEVDVPGGEGIIIHLMDGRENPVASVAHVSFGSEMAVVAELRNVSRRTPDDEDLLLEVTKSLRFHPEAVRKPTTTTTGVEL